MSLYTLKSFRDLEGTRGRLRVWCFEPLNVFLYVYVMTTAIGCDTAILSVLCLTFVYALL